MRRLSIICGMAGLIILATTATVGGLVYADYDHLTQFISELGATGATTGLPVSLAFIVSGSLLSLFWLSAMTQFPRTPPAVTGFVLSALNGLGLMFGGVFPCDFECAFTGPSQTAALHDALSGVGYLSGIAGIFLIALSAHRWPRHRYLFPLGLVCAMPAALAVGFIHPAFEWRGAAQRVVELGLALFAAGVILALARDARRAV
jgi:hypothetical membrane protein